MKTKILALSAAVLLAGGPHPPNAQAQMVVIDPANLKQNIISAVQNTEAVLHQITQLAHEVQSLAYQIQNLQNFSGVLAASVLHQYTTQFGQLVAAMKNINGIAMNLGTLSAQYNATYPNTLAANGPLSNATMTAQLTAWLNQSRSVYQGAYNTQAQVIAALATDSQNLKNLVAQSGESQGALDAIEAGNQLSGAVAAQLLKMNNQMATLNQAQMNWIAEQTQMIQDALKKSQDLAEGYTTASSATVNRSYDRLH